MKKTALIVLIILTVLLTVSCSQYVKTDNGTSDKEVIMKSFTIDGVDIKEFKYKDLLIYDNVTEFKKLMNKSYIGYEIPDHIGDMSIGEHYIVFDNSLLPYTDYKIEVKYGSLYIRGSYSSFGAAVDKLCSMIEESDGNLALTSEDNFSGKIDYPEIPYKNREELLEIFEYLQEDDRLLFGKNLAGAANLNLKIKEYSDAVGEGPSIMDMDLIYLENFSNAQKSMAICQTIDYAAKGGVLVIMHHWNNPAHPENNYSNGELDSLEDWKTVITKGTDLNREWHKDLDMAAEFIGMLKDAGVSVVYRPMIEANGGWFWWCASYVEGIYKNNHQIVSRSDMVGLWRYLHNYYTKELGLDNILWSYDPNITNMYTSVPYDYYYPGEDYCDLVGVDWYTSGRYEIGNGNTDWDIMLETRKPTGLAEFGTAGPMKKQNPGEQIKVWNCEDYVETLERMLSEGKKMAFAVTYSGDFGEPAHAGKGEALANCPLIVSLEEMPALIAEILK